MKTGSIIRLSGQLICANAQQAKVVATHLPNHVRLSNDEPGCISFGITQTENPLVWQVEEAFEDQAAFEFHQQRTRGSAWWAATHEISRAFAVFEKD